MSWGYICLKGCFAGLIFGEENRLGLTGNKNSLKHYENSLKKLITANTNSPRAYIREGLLSEGFLRLRFGGGGGGALFLGGLLSEFYGMI